MYLDAGIGELNLLIHSDFNMVSTLRLAVELNAHYSIKVILDQIF